STAALAAGARNPAAYQFTIPFSTGYGFAIQPATTPPGASSFLASGGVEYFVSSMARFSIGGGVALWAVRNTTSFATPSPNLVLMRMIVPTLSYTPPDVATQPAGELPLGSTQIPPQPTPFLDGGDNRVQSL